MTKSLKYPCVLSADAVVIAKNVWYSPSTGGTWSSQYHQGHNPNCEIRKLATKWNGYWYVQIAGKSRSIHRLAWIAINGPIKMGMVIDHIDGDRSNNRMANLRVIPFAENVAKRVVSPSNTNGIPGVRMKGDRWEARVGHRRKIIRIGTFDSREDAYQAYLTVKRRIHGELSVISIPKTSLGAG